MGDKVCCTDSVGVSTTVDNRAGVAVAVNTVRVSVGKMVGSTFPQLTVSKIKIIAKRNRLQVDILFSRGVSKENVTLQIADAEVIGFRMQR